jgi:thioredoxin 1
MLIHLDRSNIKQHLEAPGIALVNWTSGDSATSLLFEDIFEHVAETNPDVRFGTVDVIQQSPLAKEWSVERQPSVMVYRDGILLFVHDGPLNPTALQGLVQAAWTVDMEEERKHVNGHRRGGLPAAHDAASAPTSAANGRAGVPRGD